MNSKIKELTEELNKIELAIKKREATIDRLFLNGKQEKDLTSKEDDEYQNAVLKLYYLKEAKRINNIRLNACVNKAI